MYQTLVFRTWTTGCVGFIPERSKTKGMIQEIILSNESHFLVSIPPKIWNGFCSSNNKHAILANCSDIPHDKEEIIRLPYDDPKFPYKWRT